VAPRLRPAVFLDRDGVLNRAFEVDGVPTPPPSPVELELLPGVVEACHELAGLGFVLLVVTNQPDIARGRIDAATVDALNRRLRDELPLTDVLVCPHDDADGCACRKPAPGLLLDGARRHGVDLGASVMVGDRWRDVEAGRRAGVRTVFVDHGYAERSPDGAELTVGSLAEAVPWIAARLAPDTGTGTGFESGSEGGK
jgi:D-glycero-D-manno-heptose 1,7-bisphosphate phosphatase